MTKGEKVFWALYCIGLFAVGIWALREMAKPEVRPTPPVVRLPKVRLGE